MLIKYYYFSFLLSSIKFNLFLSFELKSGKLTYKKHTFSLLSILFIGENIKAETLSNRILMGFNKSIFLSALYGVCGISLFGAEGDAVKELAMDMSIFTKTATAEKQNIDYLPFIVSVWDGEKLSKMGARTLKDALMLFPGVDVSKDNVNNKSVIFRGSNPFAYGQSKLIIDGVTVNDRTFDGYSTYLDMPIDIIKRVEVVRGPGNFADGENGYAGSINVVTYAENGSKDFAKVVFGVGSSNIRTGSFVYNKKLNNFSLHTDGYYYKDELKTKTNGKDGLYYNPVNSALSRDGYAPTALTTYALGVALSGEELKISARATGYDIGSSFGNLYAIPNDEGKQKLPSWYVDGKYKKAFSDSLLLELNGGYMEDGWESDARSYPPGMRIGTVVYPDGYYADLAMKNRIWYTGGVASYDLSDSHTVKFGIKYQDEKNIYIKSITTNRATGIGMYDYSVSAPFFDAPAAKRTTTKLYMSGMYDINDDLAFSYGLNSDKGSDFDRQTDYRGAVVWQADDDDILKFMASTAYRAPAWQELYTLNNPARVGNRDLKPERVRAFESQYIKKLDNDDSVSVNLFYLQNKNQINKVNAQNKYMNAGDSDIYGCEAELKKNIGLGTFLYAGYSHASSKGGGSDRLVAAAQNMLKASVITELGGGFSGGASVFFIDSKQRVEWDNRADTPSYVSGDLTLNYDSYKGRWGAQLLAKNIGNASILYPSEKNTYIGDYPAMPSTVYLKLYKRF